jgi:hypothetical protein
VRFKATLTAFLRATMRSSDRRPQLSDEDRPLDDGNPLRLDDRRNPETGLLEFRVLADQRDPGGSRGRRSGREDAYDDQVVSVAGEDYGWS